MPRLTTAQQVSRTVYTQLTESGLTDTQRFAITQGLLIRILRDLPPAYRGVSLALAKLEEEGSGTTMGS